VISRQGAWQNFSIMDGLPGSNVNDILEDRQGRLWFVTRDTGVCSYDGAEFITFTEEDGLAGDDVCAILEDRAGQLWFATDRGCCRYDGRTFTTFTTQDGLGHNWLSTILEDRAGQLWFGTKDSGVSRFDGTSFSTLSVADGLSNNRIVSMLEDRAGQLWFATGNWEVRISSGGVSRYDGREFTNFTSRDGLGDNDIRVKCIEEDRSGHLWISTGGAGVRSLRWTKVHHLYHRGRSGAQWGFLYPGRPRGISVDLHRWRGHEPVRWPGVYYLHYPRWTDIQ
jgi:ligand-binding sensor domain-containing protein